MKFNIETTNSITTTMIEAQGFDVHQHIRRLRKVLEDGDYSAPESSVNLPTDERLLEDVESLVNNLNTATLKYIFIIGIGGSNLGTKAIYEAIYLARDIIGQKFPKLFFIDTSNSVLLDSYLKILDTLDSPEEYLCVSISKSGGTTETIANTEIFLAMVEKKWGICPDRFIVISDVGSHFIQAAQKIGTHYLTIPTLVGGRYSVFSAVGLVPLALAGFDIRELRQGAESMLNTCTHLEV